MNEKLMGVIGAVLLVIVVTALAPTISTSTSTALNSTGGTGAGSGALVNVSTAAKSIYPLVDITWAFMPIGIIIGALYLFFKKD